MLIKIVALFFCFSVVVNHYIYAFELLPNEVFEAYKSYVGSQRTEISCAYRRIFNLSICSIFKDEAPYLKEWIEYHKLLGVDHFYLYSIDSSDSFKSVVKPYVKQGTVTLVEWPEVCSYLGEDVAFKWALCTQIPAYENAVNFIARHETKWLVFVDINEYLLCPKKRNLTDLLEKYDEYAGVSISTDYFDASMDDPFSKRKLLVQTLAIARPPLKIIDKSVFKMIFKPDLCRGFSWPPYKCNFANSHATLATLDRKELRINCYINRDVKRPPPPKKI